MAAGCDILRHMEPGSPKFHVLAEGGHFQLWGRGSTPLAVFRRCMRSMFKPSVASAPLALKSSQTVREGGLSYCLIASICSGRNVVASRQAGADLRAVPKAQGATNYGQPRRGTHVVRHKLTRTLFCTATGKSRHKHQLVPRHSIHCFHVYTYQSTFCPIPPIPSSEPQPGEDSIYYILWYYAHRQKRLGLETVSPGVALPSLALAGWRRKGSQNTAWWTVCCQGWARDQQFPPLFPLFGLSLL
ncbi:hypothetical protein BD289DRAFT_153501 [Coniella lustricola]|uniref:Uncharacterized protein n=1 Tax=Coniella lustricola TaxID=2025994 RepID=A0A2T3AMI5_9PEZI|nr:hypothetical protein BD289DRAFT_153501 [Coniella lustricola]